MDTLSFEIHGAQTDPDTAEIIISCTFKATFDSKPNVTYSVGSIQKFPGGTDRATIITGIQLAAETFKSEIPMFDENIPAAASVKMEKIGAGGWQSV